MCDAIDQRVIMIKFLKIKKTLKCGCERQFCYGSGCYGSGMVDVDV